MALCVFGLTGGIGSGKSTVASLLRERGVPVVDADELARAAVAPGSDGLAELARAFGAEMLDAAGALDRKKLGAVVFAEPEQRARLNAILHPRVRHLAQQRFAELERSGVGLAAYDVPLLFEVGLERQYRPIVVVAATEAQQIARVMKRDGLTEEQARSRVRAQLPLGEKQRRADYVIDNDGALEKLAPQVDALLERLRAGA
jgi:dephospho-CoA kinase